MNFDWRVIYWVILWVDEKYAHWGSPMCPEEPHSHRKGTHWVNYAGTG